MNNYIFPIVLVIILAILYTLGARENYFSDSYNITPQITTDMDWKGAMLSKYPYYTNNLENPPPDVLKKIQELQKYNPKTDGTTRTNYVSTDMSVEKNLSNPFNREGFDELNNSDVLEGFTLMNPYISN